MLGAIIGDMIGSAYERKKLKTKDFSILNRKMRMTDDSLLTLAVAKTLIKHYPIDYSEEGLKALQTDLAKEFVNTWSKNKSAGFGGMFYRWCEKSKNSDEIAPPYNSYGNGSAMRISPVGWVANSEEEVKILSKAVTEITHNHPEGIKGAEAIAMAIFLALHSSSKEEIKERMIKDYYPEIEKLDYNDLLENYYFSPTCQESVPQAIYCFLISDGLEDTIRSCIAIGGDSDTTSAMAGSIAEAYYQKDELSMVEDKILYFLIEPEEERFIKSFYKTIGSKKFIK